MEARVAQRDRGLEKKTFSAFKKGPLGLKKASVSPGAENFLNPRRGLRQRWPPGMSRRTDHRVNLSKDPCVLRITQKGPMGQSHEA